MKRKYLFTFLSTFSIVILFNLLYSCGDDSVNPQTSYIGGTVTFTNTTLSYSGGYYAISFYGDSTNPFTKAPILSDSLAITVSGGVASAYYKESSLPTGNYYIAATWISHSSGDVFALGTYGCDTVANCTSTVVTFPNYAGTGAVNMMSYTSIYKALFIYHHP